MMQRTANENNAKQKKEKTQKLNKKLNEKRNKSKRKLCVNLVPRLSLLCLTTKGVREEGLGIRLALYPSLQSSLHKSQIQMEDEFDGLMILGDDLDAILDILE